jgi:hypothetical protein
MSSITNEHRLRNPQIVRDSTERWVDRTGYDPNADYSLGQLYEFFRGEVELTLVPVSEHHIIFMTQMMLVYLEKNTSFDIIKHPWFYSMMEHILSECFHLNIQENMDELVIKKNCLARDLFLKAVEHKCEDMLIANSEAISKAFLTRTMSIPTGSRLFFEGLKRMLQSNRPTSKSDIRALKRFENGVGIYIFSL